jgi:hypothetical protein
MLAKKYTFSPHVLRFKGRIGEAIVEAILFKFGYSIKRAGYEFGYPPDSPDLLVTNRKTGEKMDVEVKYTWSDSRTKIQLPVTKLTAYKKDYPGTIVVVASAYDAAIYCARIEDIPFNPNFKTQTFDLFADFWKPLWEMFDLVKRGDALRETWEEFRTILSTYGTLQIKGRQDNKLWDEEYEALASWLDNRYESMAEEWGVGFTDNNPKPDANILTLEELWEAVRQNNALDLAMDLRSLELSPQSDETEESPEAENILLEQIRNRALGRKGELMTNIDLEAVVESLKESPNELDQLWLLGSMVWLQVRFGTPRTPPDKWQIQSLIGQLITNVIIQPLNDPDASMEDRERALSTLDRLPDAPVAYPIDQAVPMKTLEPIRLKTFIKMVTNRCRIDR